MLILCKMWGEKPLHFPLVFLYLIEEANLVQLALNGLINCLFLSFYFSFILHVDLCTKIASFQGKKVLSPSPNFLVEKFADFVLILVPFYTLFTPCLPFAIVSC